MIVTTKDDKGNLVIKVEIGESLVFKIDDKCIITLSAGDEFIFKPEKK